MSNLKDKLIRVERSINVYDKENELVNNIDINIPIDKLKEIVQPNLDDPELYDGYKLSIDQLKKINTHLKIKVDTFFEKYSYYLVAGGIYDWNK